MLKLRKRGGNGTLTLRVTIFTLPDLPPSENQRWRLWQYEHKQAVFAHPKYHAYLGSCKDGSQINKTQAGKVWNHFAIVKDAFFLSFRSYFSSSTLSKCWLSVVRQAVEKQLRSGLYSFSSFASYSSLVNVLGVSLYNVYGFFLRVVVCSKHWLLQWLYIFLSGRTVYTGWCYWTRSWIIVSNHLHTT